MSQNKDSMHETLIHVEWHMHIYNIYVYAKYINKLLMGPFWGDEIFSDFLKFFLPLLHIVQIIPKNMC